MASHFHLKMIPVLTLTLAFNALTATAKGEPPAQPAATKDPGVAMILSTGDNLFYYNWFPIDSPLGIAASFDLFKSRFNVDRIIWRGAQAQWMTHDAVFRPEAEEIADLYAMEMNLETRNHLSHIAGQEAAKRGLAFWGYMPLFEVGASEDAVTMAGLGPYNFEDRFRSEHPEFRLHDRAGIETGGTIEFGFPEVRHEFLRRYEKYFQPGGDFSIYSGIIFYTYVENFFPRSTDQFIYSDVAARDFKTRYGIDVYTQPFDMDKYMQLRGEYVTQYLREMRALFNKYGKKLAFYIDTRDPDVPMHWPAYRKVLTPSRVKMDWRLWIKEGLVDELVLRDVRGMDDVQPFLDAARGTHTQIGILADELPPELRALSDRGVTVHIWSPALQPDFPPENDPPSALSGTDRVAKMSVLRQARDGSLDLPVATIVDLLQDPDIIVRRRAVEVAVARQMKDAVPAMESAAMDPENNFRCNDIDALGTLHGPNTVAAIGRALEAFPVAGMRIAARTAWSEMFPNDAEDLIALYHNTNSSYVKKAIVEMLVAKRAVPPIKAIPSLRPLVEEAADAPDPTLRTVAALAAAYYPDATSATLLMKMMDDPSEVVQNSAVFSLGEVARRVDDRDIRESIFQKMLGLEKSYGVGSSRRDQAWGYRVVAEAMMFGFGPRGEKQVVETLNGGDSKAADLAWRVLFHPNDGWNFYLADTKELESLFAYHPGPNLMHTAAKSFALAPQTTLLSQDFSNYKVDPIGRTGDIWSSGGRWTGLDSDVASPVLTDGRPALELKAGRAGRQTRLIGTFAWDMPDGRFKNRLRGHFPTSPPTYGVADGVVELSFDIRKSAQRDGIHVSLCPDTPSRQDIGFVMNEDGQVGLSTNQPDGPPTPSPSTIASKDGWRHFVVRFDFQTGKEILLMGDQSPSVIEELPFNSNDHYRVVAIESAGEPGTATRLAALRLTQTFR